MLSQGYLSLSSTTPGLVCFALKVVSLYFQSALFFVLLIQSRYRIFEAK